MATVNYRSIGFRIKEKRKQLNITQETMAADLDISSKYLSKVENGRAHCTLETLANICDYLDMDLGYVVNNYTVPSTSQYIQAIESFYMNANPKQKKFLLKIIEIIANDEYLN